MLQAIRDRATGWIAWFIIILICIPFALWGIQEYVSPQGSLTVATVNDTEIGYYEFQNAYQTQRRQMEQMLGQRVNNAVIEREIRDQTLQQIIDDEVLVQTSLAAGLRVGDQQLAESIQQLPLFAGDEGFSQERYDSLLRSRGMSPQRFEYDMRRSLLSEQLMSAVRGADFITNAQADRLSQVRNRVRQFRSLTIDAAKLDVSEPDAAQIKAWFEAHSDQYRRPLRVKVAYITLDRAAYASQVAVEEAELKAIYESQKQNYRTAEQRDARHILITVDDSADEASVAAAKGRIEALRQRLDAGEDFSALAREASEDPGSASNGGALGAFGRGVMDPAFEQAAFSLDQGIVSAPVRSAFGWHLIEVTAIQPQQLRTFEQVRDEILVSYQAREAERIFAENVDRLSNLSFEHPESLEVAAEELGVEINSSDFFSRNRSGSDPITIVPAAREAAYSLDVLEDGNNSELVELSPGRVAVLRIIEREEARPMTLQEASDQIKATLLNDARASAALTAGEAALEKLQAGASPEEVAQEFGLNVSDDQEASPANPGGLSSAARRALFALPAPQTGQRRYVGLAISGGGYQLLELKGISSKAGDSPQQAKEQLRRRVESSLASATAQALVRGVRTRAKVQVFEDRLSNEESP